MDGQEEKVVINRYINGKQDGPETVYTSKDAQFKTIVSNLPKDLKGVTPGVGTLEINSQQFSGLSHVLDPNYIDYAYAGNGTTCYATVYTNRIAAALVKAQDALNPDNFIKSAGVGVEASGSVKYGGKGHLGKGLTTSPSAEVKATGTVQILSNDSYTDYANENITASAETTTQSVGFSAKKVLSTLGFDTKLDAGAFFMFSDKENPVPTASAKAQNETQYGVTIFYFKAAVTTNEKGNHTVKLGVTANPGLEYKKTEKTKVTVESETTQTSYHH